MRRRSLLLGAAAAATAGMSAGFRASAQIAGSETRLGSGSLLPQGAEREAQGTVFWKHGVRLVVSVSLLLEAGAPEVHDSLPIPDPESGYQDSVRASIEAYTYNEGIPRLLELFDRHAIKATSHVLGAVADSHPDVARDIMRRGHEIAAHGYSGKPAYLMTPDEEHAEYEASIDTLLRTAGVRPLGFAAPGMRHSPKTLGILQSLGFIYHVDDVSRDGPFTVDVDGKRMAVIPYTLRNNDYLRYSVPSMTADDFSRELNAEFDSLYEEAAVRRRMMSVTAHDRISGTPNRAKALGNFIARALKKPGVVFMRKDQIAHYVLA
jgi:peptidoglycan/xylan/chitin deacetylase (PgdA/CDA1 family)